jgi:hypothetical protein
MKYLMHVKSLYSPYHDTRAIGKGKYIKSVLETLIMTAVLSGVTLNALAANYYVSSAGSDNNNGTSNTNAWRTVAKVNSRAKVNSSTFPFQPGDNIYFRRGDVWHEKLEIRNIRGTAENRITFAAYGTGEKPVFNGKGVDFLEKRRGALIHGIDAHYVTVDSLHVREASYVDTPQINERYGISFFRSGNIEIKNCEAHRLDSAGIITRVSNSVVIDSNEVSSACRDSKSESISLGGVSDFEVKNNEVHHNHSVRFKQGSGSGIDAKNGSHDGTIHHNEIHHMERTNSIYVDAYSKHTYNIEVYNNHVHDSENGRGISLNSEAGGLLENIKVHHNLVSDQQGVGINIGSGNPHLHQGVTEFPLKDLFVYNNTLVNCAIEGSHNAQGTFSLRNGHVKNINIKNNILSRSESFAFGFSPEVPPAVRDEYHISYNFLDGVVNSTTVQIIDGVTGAYPILGYPESNIPLDTNGYPTQQVNLTSNDPLFVSAANFHLQANSPAIGACDVSVWQGMHNIKDYDGNPVTDENGNLVGRVSCGAYSNQNDGTHTLPAKQWQLISLPRDPGENNSVEAVFGDDGLGEYDRDWVLWAYDSRINEYSKLDATSPLKQSLGYWMIQINSEDKTLDLPEGSKPTPVIFPSGCSASTKGCFEIPLSTEHGAVEWNLISYPFEIAASLGNATVLTNDAGNCPTGCPLGSAESQSLVHNELWKYNGTGYIRLDSNKNFDSWNGYWAATLNQSDGSNPRLLIPKP